MDRADAPVAAIEPAAALAEGISAIRYSALPPATVAATTRLILDSLAVALAGRGGDDVRAVAALAEDWGGKPEASVLGTRLRVPATSAALVNGTMIQALDFDDTHDRTAAHVASTVLAAALAACEARRRSGQALVAAVAAGVEAGVRVGLACRTNIGWTSTAIYGAFGATAAAAHALGLDAQRTHHAFGIVLSQAAGSTQTAVDWPLSKHMQSGFAAKAGVLSALLAERGVTGIRNVFAGRFGFFRLYKPEGHDPAPIFAPWGDRWHVDELSLKPYTSCRATHAPIDAARALAAGFDADGTAEVCVTVPPVSHQLAGKPFDEGDNPVISAQFSIAYTVATALLRRTVSLAHFRLDAIRDPRVRALAGRVRVAIGEGGDFAPARVELVDRAGCTRAVVAEALKGDPATPLDDAELREKVRDCLAYAPAGGAPLEAGDLWRLVESLPAMDDAGALCAALAPRG